MLRRKIGDFYLTELVGTGGMSQVFLAINPRSGDRRAVKILPCSATRTATSYLRFRREIQIIRSLSHRRVVKILEHGRLEDAYYYMMPYYPAGSLARRLERGRPRIEEAARLIRGICEAMAHAHAQGIVHRDLKPANILLDELDENDEPLVSDFGIAKVLDDCQPSLTRSNEIIGTIAYLSPEQRLGSKNVDRRADVYALGAILYEMIMGFPPLGNFPWPREVSPHFAASVEKLLRRSLALAPLARYSDAGEMLIDAERLGPAAPGRRSISRSYESASDSSHGAPKPSARDDRIAEWLSALRNGTTRERLSVVRQMVEAMEESEAKTLLKIYPTESDRVRWGLIRALGELGVVSAATLIQRELANPYLRECALDALGKIGSPDTHGAILELLEHSPESLPLALLPLARTGGPNALPFIAPHLQDQLAVVRQAAARAVSSLGTDDALSALNSRLSLEGDEKVRQVLLDCMRAVRPSNSESIRTESFVATPLTSREV